MTTHDNIIYYDLKYLWLIILLQHQRTALHIAAERGHTHIVDLLVDKIKADPLARTKDGSTLIHVASESGIGLAVDSKISG